MTRRLARAAATTAVGALVASGLTLSLSPASTAVPTATAGGPAELLRYVGEASSATGNAISNGRCDVNGDSFEDAVVGAWFWDKAPAANVGAAYVLLGSRTAEGGSLADPADVDAGRLDGPTTDPSSVGFSVGCLGDVNGDGFDDVAVGDYQKNRAIVVFGAKTFTGVNLDQLGDRGFIVREPFTAAADRANVSFSMAAVGDLNKDGKDDFAVSAVVADTRGRTNNGRVSVVAGRDDISDVNLAEPAAGQVLLSVDGALSEERLGSVAAAGDVNGDGTDDFVLGSYTSTPWGAGVAVPGAAYVVLGGTTGAVDAAALGSQGFAIYGPDRQRDRLGVSVSPAGDVDGDGMADLLIGADGVTNGAATRNGSAVIVLGSASTATVYTDPTAAKGQSVFTCATGQTPPSCDTPTRRGYWINGAASSDSFGYSLAGIGDVNGDGTPDFGIGAWGHDPVNPQSTGTTMSNAGATYVVFGRTTGAVQNVAGIADADGYRIDGLKAGDRFGRQVGLIGDFDGNGTRDLVSGADFASRTAATGAQNGELVVALMGRLTTATTLTGPAEVLPGQSATFTAAVTKPAGSQAALAEGTVAFTLDGAAIAGCSAVPVTAGGATCVRAGTADELDGEIVATYAGSDRLQTSASAGQPFAVARTVTTTALSVSDLDPRAGQLVQLVASVSAETADPVGTGTVRFTSDEATVAGCAAVPVSDGTAICTTSWPSISDPQVAAAYSGTASLGSSASGATTVSVGSTSVIKPDQATAHEFGTTPPPLTGEVRTGDDVATGTLTVGEGDTELGSATLENGEYSVALEAGVLEPGSHTLTLRYSGDSRNRPSQRTVSVTVEQATATSTVTPSGRVVRAPGRLTLTVAVTAPGTTPAGSVEILVNGKVFKTKTLGPDGTVVAKLLPFRNAGAKRIKVRYLGSDLVAPTVSAVTTVTAR